MRKLMAVSIVAFAVLGGGVATSTAHANSNKAVAIMCPGISNGVKYYRSATWSWQDKLGIARSKSNFSPWKIRSCNYAKWVANKWSARAYKERKKYSEYLNWKKSLSSNPINAICSVFGSYCSQALSVSRCESGLSTGAQNGQYLGMFQMGSHERAVYGHGSDALTQARAAYAYFVASGRDWSPWQCKP